jgi:hypothetical protein
MGKIGIGVDIFDDLVFNFNLCYSINSIMNVKFLCFIGFRMYYSYRTSVVLAGI